MSTFPFPIRATTGGVPRRSRSSMASSGIRGCETATQAVGRKMSGRAPPPGEVPPRSIASDRTVPEARSARMSLRALARTRPSGSRSIRRTGTRSRARRSSAWSRRTAESAARHILSTRTARESGCVFRGATRSSFPRMIPACGPPRSLSPLAVTIPGPAERACRSDSAPGIPCGERSINAPEPWSSMTGIPARSPRRARSAVRTSSVKPCMEKLDRRTLRRSAVWPVTVFSYSDGRVRFFVPTPPRRPPLPAMMSGIRNDPPISTSSPRLTITSRPRAWPARHSNTAAALLLTTWAHSAPVRARSIPSTSDRRDDRFPSARSNSRFEYPRAVSTTAATASSGNGARPRLVWTITPEALITLRIGRASLEASSPGSIERIRSDHSSRERKTRSSPIPARATPRRSRSAPNTTARGWERRNPPAAALASRDATDGRVRSARGSGIAGGGSGLRQFPEKNFLAVKGVLAHEFLGEVRVALAERVDDLPMLPDRPLDPPRHGEDQAEPPELHDHILDDRVQFLVPAGAQEDVVELVVQVEQPAKVFFLRRGLDLAVDRLHLRQVALLEGLDGAPGRVPLEDHLQVVEVGDVLRGQGGDDRTLSGHHGDEAFRLQLAERFADRRPADPELVREFRFRDAGSGGQLTVDDGVADRLHDPFAEGHVVVDPDS